MKKIIRSFPKILVLILGLMHFNCAVKAQLPAVKKTVTQNYPDKPDMAYAAFVEDVKAGRMIFHSDPEQYFAKISDNYRIQSGDILTLGNVCWLIMNPVKVEIRRCSHDSVVNSYWSGKEYIDCPTDEDPFCVFYHGYIILKLGDKCFNPARLKYPSMKTYHVEPEPLVENTPPVSTMIMGDDVMIETEAITTPNMVTQAGVNTTPQPEPVKIIIKNNNNDFSTLGLVGAELLFYLLNRSSCAHTQFIDNQARCPFGTRWVQYKHDPTQGQCVSVYTSGTSGLSGPDPVTYGQSGLPSQGTVYSDQGQSGLPSSGYRVIQQPSVWRSFFHRR